MSSLLVGGGELLIGRVNTTLNAFFLRHVCLPVGAAGTQFID